ncbi:MAG: rhamnan synthesis F family protein [Turneriella sp.]|nr:rhamnan synthesis F family protein [Turneriella sp.]
MLRRLFKFLVAPFLQRIAPQFLAYLQAKAGRPHVHVEFFSQYVPTSGEHCLVGWTTQPEIRIRARSGNSLCNAVPSPRIEKGIYGFSIELPQKKNLETITVEEWRKGQWQKACELKPVRKNKSLRLAVLIHAHYPDILLWLLRHCRQVLPQADIYVHLAEGNPADRAWDRRWEKQYQLEVLRGTAHGRDSLGFIRLYEHISKSGRQYDFYLKLHTKRSPQFPAAAGEAWLELLFLPLIGKGELSWDCIVKFLQNPETGILGSAPALIRQGMRQDVNYSRYKNIEKILGLTKNNFPYFVGGTMFWLNARVADRWLTAEKIAQLKNCFEPDQKAEPSYAHAMERIWGAMVEACGKSIVPLPIRLDYRIC